MQNHRHSYEEFESASEILRQKLHVIEEEKEMRSHANQNQEASDEEDDSNSDYLFGDDIPERQHSKKKRNDASSTIWRRSETLEIQLSNDVPVKRTVSRALSQQIRDEKKSIKSKTRYKKADNVGNEMIQEKKLDTIFKFICEPSRTITVNSLGHALQRFKVNFEIKDIVDMLKLHSSLTNSPTQNEEVEEDSQNLDLKANLNEQQFKQLYQIIRKRPKK